MLENSLGGHVVTRKAVLQLQVDLDLFAAFFIAHQDSGHVHDLRKLANDGFDLARSDVFAGTADHVLRAPDKPVKAGLVAAHQIAGLEPFTFERFRIRIRPPPVALEDPSTAHPKLPRSTDRRGSAVSIDQLELS